MYFSDGPGWRGFAAFDTASFTAATRNGLSVHESRLPRSMEFMPIRHALNRKSSRYLEATSITARFAVSSYAMD